MHPLAVALAVTLAVEVPVVVALYPRQRLRMGITCALATTFTYVMMNTLVRRYATSWEQYILIGEFSAVAVEAAVYALVSRPRDVLRALLASGIANGLSFGAGLLIF